MKQYWKETLAGIVIGSFVGIFSFLMVTQSGYLDSSYRAYVITSGSMEPTVKTASVIVTRSQTNYNIGDIVTFKNGKQVVTHRIDGVNENNTFSTKGDANEEADRGELESANIIGERFIVLPYAGYFVSFLKTPKGFVALIVIPASILIYEELKAMALEIKRLIKKARVPLPSPARVGMASLAPLFVGLFALVLTHSTSYYNNLQTSVDNILGASSSFDNESPPPSIPPSPIPQQINIVINEVYYDVDDEHGTEERAGQNDEWVELYNPNDFEVNLQNWTLTDNTNSHVTIVNAVRYIPANGYALISKAKQTWTYWDEDPNAIVFPLGGNIGNGLSNTGDFLILKDNNGVEIDKIGWESDPHLIEPTHDAGAPEGYSLERSPVGEDNDLADDFIDNDSPTPGWGL